VLHNIFVQRETGGKIEVALADTATYAKAAQGTHLVTLYNGRRYEGTPGHADFRVIEFREHGIPIGAPATSTAPQEASGKSTLALLGSSAPADIAALQFRTSTPLMALILSLIAVPLSQLRPRQGRYARVGFAIVVFFVYSNLLSAAKAWLEKGDLPPIIGMWWVHALALTFGLYLIARQARRA
jgi:lipopolysaccharide export system permease protein